MLTKGSRVMIVGTVVEASDLANVSVETRGHGDSIRTVTVHSRACRLFDESPEWDAGRQPITSITRTGAVATVTTPAPHNLTTGAVVTVMGSDDVEYRYSGPVTVTGPMTFTFPVVGIPATPATGLLSYVQASPEVQRAAGQPVPPVLPGQTPPPPPGAHEPVPPQGETPQEREAREQRNREREAEPPPPGVETPRERAARERRNQESR